MRAAPSAKGERSASAERWVLIAGRALRAMPARERKLEARGVEEARRLAREALELLRRALQREPSALR
jgi:hypothetical protein